MSLRDYRQKRKFARTPEPQGSDKKKKSKDLRFVVQWHHASREHYDFRLEFDGVLKSWAVPKGPSLNPADQRLAVHVEDHPLEYGEFEGVIPSGNYGAGTVMVWDEGTYLERSSKDARSSEIAMKKGLAKGHMTFVLTGQKLSGEFALIRLKDGKNWLLVKKRDRSATSKRYSFDETSVKTERTIDQITAESEAKGDIWLSKRKDGKADPYHGSSATRKKPTLKLVKGSHPPKPAKVPVGAIPRRNKPMIATVARDFVEGKGWIYEPELDGIRAIAEVENKRVHLYSKSFLPFEKKYAGIVDELRGLGLTAVLDGEIVKNKKGAQYVVYDLLFGEGRDLREAPLSERKEILEQILIDSDLVKRQKYSAKAEGLGANLIAKKLASRYQSGTHTDWLKLPEIQTTSGKAKFKSGTGEDVRLTHLDKIYFPEDGITKGDVIEYYRSISKFILPHLKDRPESLNRFPNGITSAGFYQKDMTGYLPKFLKTVPVYATSRDQTTNYALCQDERSLLYLANLGCIEMNPWFSRVDHFDHPDYCVIDLDPDDNPFSHVVEVAHEVHRVCQALGVKTYVKTSGATGIHIAIPTHAKYDFDFTRDFAEEICKVVHRQFPSTTSLDRNPNRRRRKIYLDFMQNRRGQTLASAYCIRPRPKAPVSMPLEWKELTPSLKPEQFTIKNAARRLAKVGDLWKPVLTETTDLKKALKQLEIKFSKP